MRGRVALGAVLRPPGFPASARLSQNRAICKRWRNIRAVPAKPEPTDTVFDFPEAVRVGAWPSQILAPARIRDREGESSQSLGTSISRMCESGGRVAGIMVAGPQQG